MLGSQSSFLGLLRHLTLLPWGLTHYRGSVSAREGCLGPKSGNMFNFLSVGVLLNCRETSCISVFIPIFVEIFSIAFLSPLNIAAL